ncbi:MAG: hypothetical protein ACXVBH_07435 [Flavisolibacter sp.]
MKKVFALVFALGAMTAVFAQGGYDHRNESRDVILGQQNRTVYDNDHDYHNGYYGTRDREEQIDRIRREYNWKIENVEHDRYLRRGEKRRQIRFLENEREARIRQVMDSYRYQNDRNYRRERY